MRAGKLRHRIAIQEATTPSTAYGKGIEASWATVATRWGQIRPLSGHEVRSGAVIQPETTVEIALRYYEGLTTNGHRLVHGSTIYDILSIRNTDERNREMVCSCKVRA